MLTYEENTISQNNVSFTPSPRRNCNAYDNGKLEVKTRLLQRHRDKSLDPCDTDEKCKFMLYQQVYITLPSLLTIQHNNTTFGQYSNHTFQFQQTSIFILLFLQIDFKILTHFNYFFFMTYQKHPSARWNLKRLRQVYSSCKLCAHQCIHAQIAIKYLV